MSCYLGDEDSVDVGIVHKVLEDLHTLILSSLAINEVPEREVENRWGEGLGEEEGGREGLGEEEGGREVENRGWEGLGEEEGGREVENRGWEGLGEEEGGREVENRWGEGLGEEEGGREGSMSNRETTSEASVHRF